MKKRAKKKVDSKAEAQTQLAEGRRLAREEKMKKAGAKGGHKPLTSAAEFAAFKTEKEIAAEKEKKAAAKVKGRKKGVPAPEFLKVRTALTRLASDFQWQSEHPANQDINWKPYNDKGLVLQGEFKKNAIPLNAEHDWAGLLKKVTALRGEILEAVTSRQWSQAERMAQTAELTDAQVDVLFDEVKACPDPRDKIRVLAQIIRTLKAAGGYDTEQQEVRGGRQAGGSRRRH